MRSWPIPPHHKSTLRFLAVFAVVMVVVGLWVGGAVGFALAGGAVIGAIVGAFTVLPYADRVFVRVLGRPAGVRGAWLRWGRHRHR